MGMIQLRTFAATTLIAVAGFTMQAQAQGTAELKATIWVDPDGCEHWVMDTGIEGFMSSHLDRDGMPVCRKLGAGPGACKVLKSDNMFAVGSAKINASNREELKAYFDEITGSTVVIDGHTDASGSDEANLALSVRRALAVAAIARDSSVEAKVRGFGEQVPVASNDTKEGRAQNRRVEISCAVAE